MLKNYKSKALLLVILAIPTFVEAASVSTELLLHPTDVVRITLSPSGERVAALTKGKESPGDLVIFERKGSSLNAKIFGTRFEKDKFVSNYYWLTDNYLVLYYDSENSATEEKYSAFSIADIQKHSISVENPLDRVVKTPWDDANHILISTSENCKPVSTCLVSYDLRSHQRKSIAEPLNLLPYGYEVFSEANVYAYGRDPKGSEQQYRLDLKSQKWISVPSGTVQALNREYVKQREPPKEITDQISALGLRDGGYIRTSPSNRVVGYYSHAPHTGFTALDPALNVLDVELEQNFPGQRAYVTQLTDDLQHGLIKVHDADQPVRTIFFDAPNKLTEYKQFASKITTADFGATHIERSWADIPVSITLPPHDVPVVGVIVVPFTGPSGQQEEALHGFNGQYKVFSQRGIAVVQALLPLPNLSGSNEKGTAWRSDVSLKLAKVLEHASSDLLNNQPVCLFGTNIDGSLALELSSLPKVGCVIAENPTLDSKIFSGRVKLLGGNVERAWPTFTLSTAVPAVYGMTGQEVKLLDPVQWVNRLPHKVMLAFDMNDPLDNVLASKSIDFRDASKKANKDVIYFAPKQVDESKRLSYEVNLTDGMVDFAVEFFQHANQLH